MTLLVLWVVSRSSSSESHTSIMELSMIMIVFKLPMREGEMDDGVKVKVKGRADNLVHCVEGPTMPEAWQDLARQTLY